MTPRKRYIYMLRADGQNDNRIFYITTKAKYVICEMLKKGATEVTVVRAEHEEFKANPNCEMEVVTVCDKVWWKDYLQGKRGW
jgi:NADH:ubiquinone oxidoreductase subunit E